jgi:hypothetical protein
MVVKFESFRLIGICQDDLYHYCGGKDSRDTGFFFYSFLPFLVIPRPLEKNSTTGFEYLSSVDGDSFRDHPM